MGIKTGQKIKSSPNNWTDYPEKIVEVAHKSKGLVSVMARHFDVTRETVYAWMRKLPEVKQAVQDSREDLLDLAENTLFEKAIKDKDATALIFLLKTLGKSRGYVERVENKWDLPEDAQLMLVMKGSKSNLLDPERI